jgi:tetratricopeptide (TPR) repeat protein
MARVPRLAPGCDIRSLPLTPADAYLLSRVDATVDEQELASITGFPPERVAEMLDRLGALGAVELAGGGASHTRLRAAPDPGASPAPDATRPTRPTRPQAAPPPCDPAEPAEDLVALRRQALARKLSGTHARATPATPAPRPEADPVNAQRTAEALGAHYDKIATDARHAQLARLLDEGKGALDRRDFDGAIHAYRMASALAPDDPGVQATCNDALRRAAGALADGYWEQALGEEREQRWEDAALSYARVCAGRPGDAAAHERVASCALRSGNARRAVEFARKAIELAPRSAILHVTLARAYAAAGLQKSSDGELQRALELAPDDARIQSLVGRVQSLPRRAGDAR